MSSPPITTPPPPPPSTSSPLLQLHCYLYHPRLAPLLPPQSNPSDGSQGWTQVNNPHDIKYWKIARFIVLMHKLAYDKKEFMLVDIISVKEEPAGDGKKYLIVFTAEDENKNIRTYEAVASSIYASMAKPWKVLSFKELGS
jgi:hypothetical protein